MRAVLTLAMVVLEVGVAAAQPSAGDEPPAPRLRPAPAPYAYQRPPDLGDDEWALLERGEMPRGQYIAGGIAATMFGFGTGHALQGRWSERGWIFTVGEVAGTVAWGYGFNECFMQSCSGLASGLAVGGILAVIGLRIFEIADAWVTPPSQNREIRLLRMHHGYPPTPPGYGLYLSPPHSHDPGGVAGLALRF